MIRSEIWERELRRCKAAGIQDVQIKLYPGDRHEILNETDRDQVMADIAAWLNVHVEL